MLLALGLQCKVHHHDAVLLDDADQQDDADQRDHRQIEVEHHQHQQRPAARGGQRREDRERMDVALVEHPENDVHGQQRRQDQKRRGLERGLEGLRRALEGAEDRRGQADPGGDLLDRGHRLTEGHPGGEIEGQRDGRELALVINRQVARVAGVVAGEGRERHLLVGERGLDIDLAQRVGIAQQ